jgi:5-formyltetrahydrofolate cyclo-ligase
MPHHDKKALRQHFKSWRQVLSEETKLHAAEQLIPAFWSVCASHPLCDPKQMYVGFYTAIGGEVPTELLLQDCLQRGVHCFLPVIAEDKHDTLLQYREIFHDSELVMSDWGTQIPKLGMTQSAGMLTHLLVPALAVTKAGARLGYGAGYFDTTIHEARMHHPSPPYCLGVVYAEQCVDELPQAPWDERLDEVICV